jgi:hypothetical protein
MRTLSDYVERLACVDADGELFDANGIEITSIAKWNSRVKVLLVELAKKETNGDVAELFSQNKEEDILLEIEDMSGM